MRARLRVVTAAAMARAGGTQDSPEWPVDPFSLKPIGMRVAGASVVVWSVAFDGDQGGRGSFLLENREGDLVVAVPRQ